MDDGDEKVRLSVSRAPNCLQASVAHVEGECRHRMWLDGRGRAPAWPKIGVPRAAKSEGTLMGLGCTPSPEG